LRSTPRWVVCRKCERWNLSPLDERWEAIEECERIFRDTKMRASTDNIGMAKVSEGLELVRIGRPQRPEMAAWRYGDQFGRRRRRYYAYAGLGATAVAGIYIIGPALGLYAIGGAGVQSDAPVARPGAPPGVRPRKAAHAVDGKTADPAGRPGIPRWACSG
jgi:hypothetical protein